jgi:hypothetical protein
VTIATGAPGRTYFDDVIAKNYEPTGTDTFSVVSGALPAGLSMPASSGPSATFINGVATRAGTFTFTVRAADPDDALAGRQTYRITVKPA